MALKDWNLEANEENGMKYIKVFVPGIPASKGSMSIGRNGQIYPADKKLKSWSRDVSLLTNSHAPEEPTTEPISLTLTFYFSKNKSTNRQEYIQKPDIDKISRAILDSLTGIVYKDDCQVYHLDARKLYSDANNEPGVLIEVRPAFNMESIK